jgi:hypothetical protein
MPTKQFLASRVAAISAMMLASIACAQNADHVLPSEPIIAVTGNGEVDVAPDRAVLTLGAVAQDKNAADAQEKVNKIVQKSLDAITDLGIKKEKIQSQRITLQPVYKQSSNDAGEHTPKIVGYEASNQLQITLEDLSQIGPVMDAGVKAGADQIDGVDFSLQDETVATQAALQKAVAQAKDKAQAIARTADVSLGNIAEIDEGNVQRIFPNMPRMMHMAAAAEVATPVQPGQIQITASVTITYKIK